MMPSGKHWQPRKINKPFGVYSRTTINIATGRPLETSKRQQPSGKETTMQEYKDWDGNLLPDPAPRIHNVHIGDIIKTTHKSIEEPLETRGRGQHRFISETREYEVIAVYPRTIQTRDRKTGFTRCFSYGDLLTMGIEHQGAEVGDMRATYGQDQKRENLTKKLSTVLSGSPGGKEEL